MKLYWIDNTPEGLLFESGDTQLELCKPKTVSPASTTLAIPRHALFIAFIAGTWL